MIPLPPILDPEDEIVGDEWQRHMMEISSGGNVPYNGIQTRVFSAEHEAIDVFPAS